MEIKPKTKKECFAQLDEMLSEADKKAILEAEDLIEFHFTLGLWIRNNWLYDRSEEELESLSKAFGIDIPYFAADDLSSEILEAYQKHLKRVSKMWKTFWKKENERESRAVLVVISKIEINFANEKVYGTGNKHRRPAE